MKIPCFSYYLLCFFLLQNQRTRGWNRFCMEVGGVCAGGGGWGVLGQIICTHVSKCKNDTCWEYSGNQGRGMKESSQGGEFKYDIFFKNTLWHKGLDDLEVPHSWHSCSNIPKMPTYIFYWKRQLYFYRFVQLNALQLEKHLVWHFL
jgi:hypothetical protein